MSDDVIFISSTLTFDASIVQMLLAWSAGSTMLIVSTDVLYNPRILSLTLCKHKVSVLQVCALLIYS